MKYKLLPKWYNPNPERYDLRDKIIDKYNILYLYFQVVKESSTPPINRWYVDIK